MSVTGGRAFRVGGGSRLQSIFGTTSDADFFTVLRTTPAIGRVFTASECQPGRDAVIVLSHGFAENQIGSPANALGNRLVLNDRSYEVIGVIPPRFYVKSWFPASTQAWPRPH
jgi:putative ABC transport system permease protein